MVAFGKKARVAHVWLTALLTLVSGIPHVQCRCPSGRLKPFCLSFPFRSGASASCCCAAGGSSSGSCCLAPDSPPAGETVPTCCNHAHGRRAREGSRAGASCCSRTLASPGEFTPSPSVTRPTAEPGWVAALPSLGPAGVLPHERGLLSWQAHLLAPPPADLVTVLQRLTI